MKAATVSGSSRWISASRLVGEARRVLLLALAGLGVAIVMRRVGVADIGDRQIEIAVVGGEAGEARGRDGDAVIALGAADDLLLARPAERVVVVPDELDRGVVRLGAGIVEEHFRHRHRHQRDEALGELGDRFVRFVGEAVIEGQAPHLLGGSLDKPLIVEAERRAPEARHGLDVILAALVPHMDAMSLDHDQRALALMLAQIGVGVEVVGDIDAGDRIAARHFLALGWNSGNIGPAAERVKHVRRFFSRGRGP